MSPLLMSKFFRSKWLDPQVTKPNVINQSKDLGAPPTEGALFLVQLGSKVGVPHGVDAKEKYSSDRFHDNMGTHF